MSTVVGKKKRVYIIERVTSVPNSEAHCVIVLEDGVMTAEYLFFSEKDAEDFVKRVSKR